MDEKTEPPVLADMMAVKISGPTLVFLRARHHMPQDGLRAFAERLERARADGKFEAFEHVKFVVLPCDFDVIAMGDVELERAGLSRVETVAGA